jgi:hypothetical protein
MDPKTRELEWQIEKHRHDNASAQSAKKHANGKEVSAKTSDKTREKIASKRANANAQSDKRRGKRQSRHVYRDESTRN